MPKATPKKRTSASRAAARAAKLQRRANLPPIDPLRRYPVAIAADYLFVSRDHVYEKIKNKQLSLIKDGKRSFVAGSELVRLAQSGESAK